MIEHLSIGGSISGSSSPWGKVFLDKILNCELSLHVTVWIDVSFKKGGGGGGGGGALYECVCDRVNETSRTHFVQSNWVERCYTVYWKYQSISGLLKANKPWCIKWTPFAHLSVNLSKSPLHLNLFLLFLELSRYPFVSVRSPSVAWV